MDKLALLPPVPTREDIDALAARLLDAEAAGAGIEVMTWHHFAPGMVSRTILIEAGTTLASGEHLTEHLCVCHGDITIYTEGGSKRFTGYHVVRSLPGAKRIGHAHADTWWTTIHLNPDDCLDVAELERRCVANPQDLQGNRHALPPAPAMEAIQS